MSLSVNHKRIGLYYLLNALLLGLSGSYLSYIIRIELDTSGNRLILQDNLNFYNLISTLHGLLMIFFLVIPGLFGGLGNIYYIMLLGSSEVSFPRVNNIAVLAISLSYWLILLSLDNEYSIGTGWTLYPPLSLLLTTCSPIGISFITFSLSISGLSSSLSSVNFLVTILVMCLVGLTLSTLYCYVWSIVIISLVLLIVLPLVSWILIILLIDLHFNTMLFNPLFGGDPVLFQHLFWFFGHPEVYVLIIPGFGVISSVLSGLLQVSLFGSVSMILAMSSISSLGSIVWGHHMFLIGMDSDTRAYFTAITLMISLPTGSKIFNWLCTYLGTNTSLGFLILNRLLFVTMFLMTFTIGGTTGVILGNATIDMGLHDSYYVIAHFHSILSLGTVAAIFSGLMLFKDQLIPSHTPVHTLFSLFSCYHSLILFLGILVTFIPMHFLGFNVIPRRVSDFQCYLNWWNYISSIGSGITLISFLVLYK